MTKSFTPEQFKEVAASAACHRQCPDQWVGIIDDGKLESWIFSERKPVSDLVNYQEMRRVFIILESPHSAEFPDTGKDGPAQGHSGHQIENKVIAQLNHIAPHMLTPGPHALVLVNAIQYQCSHGNPKKIDHALRDETFRRCWSEGAKYDFCERLKCYDKENAIWVNACTKGKSKGYKHPESMVKGWLRVLVEEAFRTTITNAENRYFRSCHPASRNWGSQRYIIHTPDQPVR